MPFDEEDFKAFQARRVDWNEEEWERYKAEHLQPRYAFFDMLSNLANEKALQNMRDEYREKSYKTKYLISYALYKRLWKNWRRLKLENRRLKAELKRK